MLLSVIKTQFEKNNNNPSLIKVISRQSSSKSLELIWENSDFGTLVLWQLTPKFSVKKKKNWNKFTKMPQHWRR